MSLLVVVALSVGNEHLFESNLDLMRFQEPKGSGYTLLLVHSDEVRVTEIATRARASFDTVHTMTHNSGNGVKEYPTGENRVWQAAARYVETKFSEKFKGWLWWEQDACPLRAGWLKEIEKVWSEGGKPFCGFVYRGPTTSPFMDRCGVWPTKISEALQSSGALFVSSAPFDRIAGLESVEVTTESNFIIVSQKDSLSLSKIKRSFPEAVLLRGTNGMLQRDLMVQKGVSEVDEDMSKSVYPSFLEQTEWKCGLFTFPYRDRTCYFNPGLARVRGKLQLFTREFQYGAEAIDGELTSDKKSRTVIWEIEERSMTVKNLPSVPREPRRFVNEQFEDPRAMVVGDEVFVSFATWVRTKDWKIRQSLVKLDWDREELEVLVEPDFGGNHPNPQSATGHEKNWMWFVHEEEWHCVYAPSPQLVFKLNSKFQMAKSWRSKEKMSWSYGEPRGGTPPVRLNENEYVSFFHSALMWRGAKRRYYMGAYTFEAKAPFEVKRMTKKPLLVGSERDFRAWESPLVIFPEGHVYENEEHLVTFGVNDEHCGWIRIPDGELDERLESL